MATNIVSLVMQFITPDMVAKIANALGLDRMIAQKAIGGAVPAILSGLAGVASAPGGSRLLSNAMSQQGGMLESITSMIGGSGQKAFAENGSNMLSGLFGGSTTDALAQSIGSFAGIGPAVSKSLVGMLGPVVLGALGQHQRSSGLDASGLASMLSSQKDQIIAAIPGGLADQLGVGGVLDRLTGGLQSGTAAASAAVGRMGSAADRTVAGASQAAYAMGDTAARAAQSTASSRWPLWVIGILALGAIAWFLFADWGGSEKVAEATPPAPAQVGTQPPATQPTTTLAGKGDRLMETANVALTNPNLTVGGVNLTNQVNASVTGLKSALGGITDATSAQAALPKLQDAITKLDEVKSLSTKLPPEGKTALAKLIAAAMPTVNQMCDRVLAMPGVSTIAKPTIDDLRGRLDTMARA
jgi:hypothetical protein